ERVHDAHGGPFSRALVRAYLPDPETPATGSGRRLPPDGDQVFWRSRNAASFTESDPTRAHAYQPRAPVGRWFDPTRCWTSSTFTPARCAITKLRKSPTTRMFAAPVVPVNSGA